MYLALSYVAAILSLVMTVALLDQYRARRRTYQLVWAIGLLMVLVGNGLWFIQEAFPLNQWVFRLWYFTGAMAGPAILGAGMVYFIAPRSLASGVMGFLCVTLLAGLALTLAASFRTPDDCAEGLSGLSCLASGGALTAVGLFPPAVFVLTILLNVYAFIALVAGGVWTSVALVRRELNLADSDPMSGGAPDGSASLVSMADMAAFLKVMPRQFMPAAGTLWVHRDFWRRDRLTRRGAGASIITLGAVMAGIGGLLGMFDLPGVHLWLVFVGLIVIYVGLAAIQDVFEVVPLWGRRFTTETALPDPYTP